WKVICRSCRDLWLPYYRRAQWLVARESDTTAAYATCLILGEAFEHHVRERRSRSRGRPRNALAVDFAIDVMANQGATDEQIEAAIGAVHAGYVKQRRKAAGIRSGKASRARAA